MRHNDGPLAAHNETTTFLYLFTGVSTANTIDNLL
jgi:hypothetical protein